MIASLFIISVVAQAPIQEASPLKEQAEYLATCPAEVKYEFIKEVVPNFGVSLLEFRGSSVDQQIKTVKHAYYLRSISMAMLIYRGDNDLVSILNSLVTNNNYEKVALEFEQSYRRKFGGWPPIIPVNVDSLISRMLAQRVVR